MVKLLTKKRCSGSSSYSALKFKHFKLEIFINNPKSCRDMNLSEGFYKVDSIFIQNGDFDVTVGKFDAETLGRNGSDVTVGTKNSQP